MAAAAATAAGAGSTCGILEAERRKGSFPVAALTDLFNGGAEASVERKAIQQLALDAELRKYDAERMMMSRVDRYKAALGSVRRVVQLAEIHGLDDKQRALLRNEGVPDALPTDLHDLAFVPFLAAQATEDQAAAWLDDARAYRILGCYAQTELAHGSNVRGIETRAVFDPDADGFILTTPRSEARKWWPGNMAKTATHAIVMARLIVGETDHGVHPFLVQLRDMESHMTLPGIELGDIGSKLGMNAVDNGYLCLHDVFIPRFNMLAKFASLDADGSYTKPAHAKVAYAGMISVRASLIKGAGGFLARAATIAVRYALQRRQFNYAQPNCAPEAETPILDYTMQQYRVLPLVATAYALKFTGLWMESLHDTLVAQMADGNFELLAEVHATAAGLKSLTTSLAGDGCEALRKSVGGVGFLVASGLPDLFSGYVGVETAEGENFLLTQQTARALLKALQTAVGGGALTGSSAYLERFAAVTGGERWSPTDGDAVADLAALVTAYEHRSLALTVATAQSLQAAIAGGKPYVEAWIEAQVEAFRMSRAHSFVVIVRNFAQLFALYWMEVHAGEFLDSGFVSAEQVVWVRAAVRKLLGVLRPDAASLVDAFDYHDCALSSAIGCYNGRVYERLIDTTRHDPMNAPLDDDEPSPGWREHLKPLLLRSRM
ncbi:Acox1 protein [Thecamonas trahens ATCC 50062]|uniref:Acyl-coenzyme A oxidase n=1 Tax=Thecamonas trahens ATCC 50062 TaxID=461836 RepID=A0A0L0DT44_THETB|nr:Acox1 protein [Thecamonas trahens ATCC 50062]KNC54603.1 Acox1 protein [Thecamonas trahens ATCC 50062]|eukprot:XP_013761512.1 Acox1 protein [Thecamonas trahens ATCC 50062]